MFDELGCIGNVLVVEDQTGFPHIGRPACVGMRLLVGEVVEDGLARGHVLLRWEKSSGDV